MRIEHLTNMLAEQNGKHRFINKKRMNYIGKTLKKDKLLISVFGLIDNIERAKEATDHIAFRMYLAEHSRGEGYLIAISSRELYMIQNEDENTILSFFYTKILGAIIWTTSFKKFYTTLDDIWGLDAIDNRKEPYYESIKHTLQELIASSMGIEDIKKPDIKGKYDFMPKIIKRDIRKI